MAFVLGEIADLQQPMHKQPQSRLGRQTAGRGVRRVQQPGLLKIRHHIADRRRREVLAQQARQGARADRLAGRDIAVDDQPEDLAAALIQLTDRRERQPVRLVLTAFHLVAPRLKQKPRPRSDRLLILWYVQSPRPQNLGMQPLTVNSLDAMMAPGAHDPPGCGGAAKIRARNRP